VINRQMDPRCRESISV